MTVFLRNAILNNVIPVVWETSDRVRFHSIIFLFSRSFSSRNAIERHFIPLYVTLTIEIVDARTLNHE